MGHSVAVSRTSERAYAPFFNVSASGDRMGCSNNIFKFGLIRAFYQGRTIVGIRPAKDRFR